MLFQLALSAVAWSTFGAAVPVTAGISPNILETLSVIKEFADAAYCQPESLSLGVPIACSQNACPLLQSRKTKLLQSFNNPFQSADVAGYLAVDETARNLILSFRGSASIQNWISDSVATRIPVDLCTGCTAHQGLWSSWVNSRQSIIQAVQGAVAQYPEFPVVVTGHSLGGAIASLAATQLKLSGLNAALYSYGAPRFGDESLCNFITSQVPEIFRVTHYNDPVPRSPIVDLGYAHISPEYYIPTVGLETVVPSSVKVCQGIQTSECNQQWKDLDILSHLQYFGQTARCFPSLGI